MPRKIAREFAAFPPGFKVVVVGEARLKKAFKDFTPKLQRKIESRVTRTIAYHIKAKTETITPVFTGAMKANYMVRVASLRLSAGYATKRRKKRKNIVGHAVKTGTRAKLRISPKDKYYYPAIVEFGAPKRNIKPNPIMRRTLKNQASQARMLFRTLMAAEVKKTIRELRAGTIRPDGVKIKK